MNKLLKNNRFMLIGAVVGMLAGYLYWKYIGCASGKCAITSKPINSTLYFALLGALAFSLFGKNKTENE